MKSKNNRMTDNRLYDTDKAKFITFEGLEGSGKSTQVKMLYDYLKSKNVKAIVTREIGRVESSEAIRDIVVNQELLPMSELMLIMAARYEHIQKLILPKLREGYTVICDRFIDSTACYQGIDQDIGIEKVYKLHRELMFNLMPDTTFFIDIKPEVALSRALSRNDNNKFEQKSLEFYNRVYQGFHGILKKFPSRIIKIDTNNLNIEEVHWKILKHL